MHKKRMFRTQCLCGATILEIEGAPVSQVYCHCRDCQHAQGAAYVLNAVYSAAAIKVIQGAPITMVVTATPRLRCASCSTPLFTEVAIAGLRSLNAYLLPEGRCTPHMHIHCAESVLLALDKLPHYARLPASFGGDDQLVDW